MHNSCSVTERGATPAELQNLMYWFCPDLYVFCDEDARPWEKKNVARLSNSPMSSLDAVAPELPSGFLAVGLALPSRVGPPVERRTEHL